MTATKTKAETETLTDLAHKALADNDSLEHALWPFMNAVAAAGLSRELYGPHEERIAREYLSGVSRKRRRVVWTRPTGPDDRVVHLARAGMENLFAFPLPNGVRLGDATLDDVRAAAEFYAKQAADMAWKGRWLTAIAAKMKGRKPVRQCLKAEALKALQDETK